jgi:hypothetical protein
LNPTEEFTLGRTRNYRQHDMSMIAICKHLLANSVLANSVHVSLTSDLGFIINRQRDILSNLVNQP